MGITRSATRATNMELREDLDAAQDSITELQAEVGGSNLVMTFPIPTGSAESTVPETGSGKLKFRVYGDRTLLDVRASLSVAQTSGTKITIDINNEGESILSTKLTIDNGETTSKTASVPLVIFSPAILDDSEISVDIDAAGDGTANGLKVTFYFGNYVEPTYDADALIYFAAANITSAIQKSAANQLFLDLKSYGIWSNLLAFYPFLGGNSSSHLVNAKSPGTFDLTFNGGITHSSTGVLWNGSTGYADTGIVPSASMTLDSFHLSYYSRTNVGGNTAEIGVLDDTPGSLPSIFIYAFSVPSAGIRGRAGGYHGSSLSDICEGTDTNNPSSAAFYCVARTSSNSSKFFRNGVSIGTNTNSSLGIQPDTFSIYIGARNLWGSANAFSARECAFASVGLGLSDTQASNFYDAVQAYQTAIGRQV